MEPAAGSLAVRSHSRPLCENSQRLSALNCAAANVNAPLSRERTIVRAARSFTARSHKRTSPFSLVAASHRLFGLNAADQTRSSPASDFSSMIGAALGSLAVKSHRCPLPAKVTSQWLSSLKAKAASVSCSEERKGLWQGQRTLGPKDARCVGRGPFRPIWSR